MRFPLKFILLEVLACLAILSCSAPPQPFVVSREGVEHSDPLLAVIDQEYQIHSSDLLHRLEATGLYPQGGVIDSSVARDTLEAMIIDRLVSLAADTFHLKNDLAGWTDYRLEREGLLKREFLARIVYPQIPMDSAEVDSFYHARADLFRQDAAVEVAHIVLSGPGYMLEKDSAAYASLSESQMDSLIDYRLRLLKAEIHDSVDFQEAARLFSQDRRTGDRGGRIGLARRFDLHSEIEKVLYDPETPIHKTIGPVESRDGHHLFYIYKRHSAGIWEMDSALYKMAYETLQGFKSQYVIKRIIDSLGSTVSITYNDSALLLDKREGDPNLWVAWAPGIDTVRFDVYQSAMIQFRAKFKGEYGLDQYKFIAQTLVDEELIYKMCVDAGITEIPEVRAELDRMYHKNCENAVRRIGAAPYYKAPDSILQAYYDAHSKDFVIKKPIKVQQIIVQDSTLAEYVKALAESGYRFLELADSFYVGEPEIRRTAADLGWIGRNDFDSVFFDAALPVEVGDVGPVVKTRYGFHIFKMLEKKQKREMPEIMGEITKIVEAEYRAKNYQNWLKLIHRGHQVTTYADGLTAVELLPLEDRFLALGKQRPDLKPRDVGM